LLYSPAAAAARAAAPLPPEPAAAPLLSSVLNREGRKEMAFLPKTPWPPSYFFPPSPSFYCLLFFSKIPPLNLKFLYQNTPVIFR
jgi:hypothetical protein